MSEPVEVRQLRSMVDETYQDAQFSGDLFPVRAVLPQRTFLEKMCLIHEELTKENVRIDRMSRHLYDIAMMMKNGLHKTSIYDTNLYAQVVEHRRKFIGLKGFDYDTLYPNKLNIIPNENVSKLWQSDYRSMCEHMIWGDAPSYQQLMEKISELNEMVRAIQPR